MVERWIPTICWQFMLCFLQKEKEKEQYGQKGAARVHTSFAWVVALSRSRRCSYIPSNGWEFIFRITWPSSTPHWKAINGASVAYRSTPEINGNFEIFGHWCFIPRPQIFNSYLGPSIEQHHPWNSVRAECAQQAMLKQSRQQTWKHSTHPWHTVHNNKEKKVTHSSHELSIGEGIKWKKIEIVISFKSTRLRVDINDFDLLNPKMKLFLRPVLYFGFYWVEKFDALKKRSKGSRRRTDPLNKYPTCLKTVRREQIVRLFAQTSLHTVGSARRTSSTHKSMEMYVGVEQA